MKWCGDHKKILILLLLLKCEHSGVPTKCWWKNYYSNSFQLQYLLFLFLRAHQIRLHWDEIIGYSEKIESHQVQLCTNATLDLISFAFCLEIYLSVFLWGFEFSSTNENVKFFSDSETAVKLVFRRADIVIKSVRLLLLFRQSRPHQRMLFCAFFKQIGILISMHPFGNRVLMTFSWILKWIFSFSHSMVKFDFNVSCYRSRLQSYKRFFLHQII